MRLAVSISLHAGGPGSGCNPAVGKCGRPTSGPWMEHPSKGTWVGTKADDHTSLMQQHGLGDKSINDRWPRGYFEVNHGNKSLTFTTYGRRGKTPSAETEKLIRDTAGAKKYSVKYKNVSMGGDEYDDYAAAAAKFYVVLQHDGAAPDSLQYPDEHEDTIVSEHDTREEAEAASEAMPYTKVMLHPRTRTKAVGQNPGM